MVLNTDYWLEKGITPAQLTLGEFCVATLMALPIALLAEGPAEFGKLLSAEAMVPVVATGVLEVIGYLVAAMGQDLAPASHAAVVMALESPFAVVIGMFYLHEVLSFHEGVGCALMFAACVLSQLGSTVDGYIEQHREKRASRPTVPRRPVAEVNDGLT
jgi:drug/metabolite transporter (DMT)-like permease